jgi:thiosulfate reductase cytochrome b subunit
MRQVHEKHHLILRLCHWLNVPLLLIMIWSGLLIYWAHQPYLKIPDELGPFQFHHRLAEGMSWHFTVMWLFVINGLIYFSFLAFSGEWREFVLRKEGLKRAIHYALFDVKILRSGPRWSGKFNPAQKLAYFLAILLAVFGVITGVAIFKPVQLNLLVMILGGYKAARFEHFLCMSGLLFFILIHLIQVARAGWNNFRSMVAGYEMEK